MIEDNGIVLVENNGLKPKDVRCAEMVLEENKELALEKWRHYFGLSDDSIEE